MPSKNTNVQVAIIMGSDSDLSIMQEAANILDEFGIGYEIKVLSAHRTPQQTAEYAGSAYDRGVRVVIAGAGGAAHLPGVVSAYFHLPVIGVPVKAKSLEGLDSLLSIVQMPPGVPVATVGINAGKNAGILAVKMLAIGNDELFSKVKNYINKMAEQSLAKNKNLN
jgi:phosphoribosylaminoimidazole carboxylase PurE protein